MAATARLIRSAAARQRFLLAASEPGPIVFNGERNRLRSSRPSDAHLAPGEACCIFQEGAKHFHEVIVCNRQAHRAIVHGT